MSVKGVVLLDGCVLLVHNERDEWELPGGRLEAGETPEACVAREVAEETGIEVHVGPIVDAWVYPVVPTSSVLVITYGCTAPDGVVPVVSHEHDDAALVALTDLDDIVLPDGYRRSIRRWVDLVR